MTMDSHSKRLSTPVIKFMMSGIASPSPVPAARSKSYDNHTPAARSNQGTLIRQQYQQQHHHNSHPTIHDGGGGKARSSTTPQLTPSREANYLVLSPSRTLADSLTELASSTAEQLEMIWDEIGYDPHERASQLSYLLANMQNLCEEKIAEENGVAVTFKQTIADVKEEMRATCDALQVIADERLLKDNDGSVRLVDELSTLETAMERIRETASAAKKDLLACRDYLVEAHEALELNMDPKWRDVESDLTLSRREEYHAKKIEMKSELETRSAAVIQLVRDCQQLIDDINLDEPNQTELDKRIMGSIVRSKDGSFMMVSKHQTSTCVGISSSAVDALMKRVAELDAEKRRRKKVLQEMGNEIATLWEKLQIPEEEQQSFIKSVQGLGMNTIARGETELKRLNKIKLTMLDKLILQSRSTIQSLWDEIDAPQHERNCFEPLRVPEALFSDHVLDQHEEYVEVLQKRLDEMRPILRLIERREEIIRERMEYEELQKDPERLQQRGASMTQQLMKEEKMARRIKKELPKLTESLLHYFAEWKAEHGEEFQYAGKAYLDIMDDQEEEWQEYKANEYQRKQMKKKEDMAFAAENRFQPFGPSKKSASRPLGDARPKENSRGGGLGRTKSGLLKPVNPRGDGGGNRPRSDTMA